MYDTLIHLAMIAGIVPSPSDDDEAGLSQSAENAILVAAAVLAAIAIAAAVKLLVDGRLADITGK